MDFDTVEEHNLDRMTGVTATDAWLRRGKAEVARRLVLENATAADLDLRIWDHSVCEPDGARHALDFDLIFCCVDRPWPRAVLNLLAYSDLVPVIDGGIAVDVRPDDDGMRNATWRSHVIRPGRPCLVCNDQLEPAELATDVAGLLDDPAYVQAPGDVGAGAGQNAAVLSISVAAALLAQYVSFNVAPGGIGEPGPLQYVLSTHTLERLPVVSRPNCLYEVATALGNARPVLTGRHTKAEERRNQRAELSLRRRIERIVDDIAWRRSRRRSAAASRLLMSAGRARRDQAPNGAVGGL